MTGPPPSSPEYREPHSALTWQLLALGGLLPGLLVAAAVVLGLAVYPGWFVAAPVVILAPPFTQMISLLMRNRRTGIAVDNSGITVGALGMTRGVYQAPWTAIASARIETSPRLVDAMMRSRRIFSPTRYWGVPRGMSGFTTPAGVLIPPFARAVLVVELAEATSVVGEPPRPRRYFGNYLNVNHLSRTYATQSGSLWLVPTRHPARLAQALAEHGFS